VTMHNMMPELPSNGVHVPFHTIVMEPFQYAFTFGPTHLEVAGGSHIGLESPEKVAGAFIGSQGEFLVTSQDQFVILTPRPEPHQLILGTALFPKKETHIAQLGQKGKSYSIRPGSCIMAYNLCPRKTGAGLKSVTVFLGVGCGLLTRNDVYRSAQGAFAQSLMHFNGIWNAIVNTSSRSSTAEANEKSSDPKSWVPFLDLAAFDPEPHLRERHADMQTPISRVIPYRMTTSTIPVVKAYPISEDRERLMEALSHKRQRIGDDQSSKSPKAALRTTPTDVQ
jgi:hypothetical protein